MLKVPPIAFAQAVRRASSEQLPLFLRRFGPLVQPVHFRASSLLQPLHFFSSVERYFPHPSSFHHQFPRHMWVLVCPSLVWSFSAQLGLAPTTLPLEAPHTRALLPSSSNRLFLPVSEAYFYVLRTDHSTFISTFTCSSNSKVCHCGHFAHDCSCKLLSPVSTSAVRRSFFHFPTIHLPPNKARQW